MRSEFPLTDVSPLAIAMSRAGAKERVREIETADIYANDLSLLLTSSFGVKAQYLRGVTPSITISGQNDRLVMGRRVQPRQVEGANVYRADDVIATSGNIQFVPFACSTPLRHVKKK